MGTNKSTTVETEDEKDTQHRQKCLNAELGFARLGLKLKVEQEEEEGEGKVCTACGLSVCGAIRNQAGTEPGLQGTPGVILVGAPYVSGLF